MCLYLHCNVIWWIKCTQLTLWQLFCLLLWQTVTMFSKGFRLTLSICIHEINSLKLIWNMSDCCHFMFEINIAQWHYLNLMSNLFFTQLDLKIEFLFHEDIQFTVVWKYCGVYKILCCLSKNKLYTKMPRIHLFSNFTI